jgi:hypothetical protein
MNRRLEYVTRRKNNVKISRYFLEFWQELVLVSPTRNWYSLKRIWKESKPSLVECILYLFLFGVWIPSGKAMILCTQTGSSLSENTERRVSRSWLISIHTSRMWRSRALFVEICSRKESKETTSWQERESQSFKKVKIEEKDHHLDSWRRRWSGQLLLKCRQSLKNLSISTSQIR